MADGRCFTFTHAMVRIPGNSVTAGLRSDELGDPDPVEFKREHRAYINALKTAGANVIELEALEEYPDSVFIEDAALCLAGHAIVLRPGAESRRGEAAAIRPELLKHFNAVLDLHDDGSIDGGDILVTDHDVFVGLSARTNEAGLSALASQVEKLGYRVRQVNTPPSILHFKTDCGLLDSNTIFSSMALSDTGCFAGYNVINAPQGEEAAANLIRFNDTVLVSEGYPKTIDKLRAEGYKVIAQPVYEAAKIDGGLSCMSLRFSL